MPGADARSRGGGVAALAFALGLGCSSPRTEVRVRVLTDLEYGPDVDAGMRSLFIRVRANGPDGRERGALPVDVGHAPPLTAMPTSFGVTPLSDTSTGEVWIEVYACPERGERCDGLPGDGTPLVSQYALTNFVPGFTSDITLFLVDACRGVPCDRLAMTTCDPCTRRCVNVRGSRPRTVCDECNPGFGDCDRNVLTGCEVDLSNSAPNCGACGTTCGRGMVCEGSRCVVQRSCPDPTEAGCGVVQVVRGTFDMGASTSCVAMMPDDGTCGYYASPPQRNVTVSAFAMDAYEVTVARFRRYWVGAGHPDVPGHAVTYPDGATLRWSADLQPQEPLRAGMPCNWPMPVGTRDDHPINCVDWPTAQAFCVWDGGRLPTEAEWEYAARGGNTPRTYPWGESVPDDTLTCGLTATVLTGTCPVTSHPSGGTPLGIYDLAGNVYEWLADWYEPYDNPSCWRRPSTTNPRCDVASSPPYRSQRGGAWDNLDAQGARSASRSYIQPTTQDRHSGFRCVRD